MEANKTKKEIYLMDVLDAVRDFNAIYTKAKEFVAAQLRNGVLPEEPLKRFDAALETLNCDMMCNPCILYPTAEESPALEAAPDPAPEPEAEPEPNPVPEPAPAPEPEPPAGDCPRPKKKYTKKSDYWARLDAARAEREAARESAKAAPGKRPYVKKDPAYWGKFEAARAEKAARAGDSPKEPRAELSMDDPGYWEAIEVRKRTGADAPIAEAPEIIPLVDDASCGSGGEPKRGCRSYGLEKVITKRGCKHSVVNPNSHRRPRGESYGRIDDEAACERLLRTAVDAFIRNGYTTYKQFRERHNNLACALWKRKGLRKRFNDEVNAANGTPLL